MFLPGTAKGAPEQTGSLRKGESTSYTTNRFDLFRIPAPGPAVFGPAFSICPAMDSASFRHGVKKNVKRKDFVNGGRKGQNRKMSARDLHRRLRKGGFREFTVRGDLNALYIWNIRKDKKNGRTGGKTDTNRREGLPLVLSNRPGVCYTGQAKDSSRNRVKRVFSGEQEQSEEDRWKERERAESRGMADCVG